MSATKYLNGLDSQFLELHHTKENAFWHTYMALSGQCADLAEAETAISRYLGDPANINLTRDQLKAAEQIQDPTERESTVQALKGWLAVFEANAIESPEARALKEELIAFESELFDKKKCHPLFFTAEDGSQKQGSLPVLAANIRTSDNEDVRQSAHQALLGLEQWVLSNGFIELVKKRNQFARLMGFDNFFDYSVQKTEKMTSEELFTILDEFEEKTRQACLDSQQALATEKGSHILQGHNFVYAFSGDSQRKLDAYVPFGYSLRRWVETFGRLNIEFSQAELTLDLLDRKGKFPNGFCHGPNPAWYNGPDWIPAKVNFTSNAKPDQVGSGYDGINTLVHEGGHAAHFANIKMNSPCFAHEFAPMSMAYAETQSMFCDSLLADADWLKLYAKNAQGDAVPDELLKEIVFSKQPFRAFSERSLMVVPYFEHALYQMEEAELTPEKITALARRTEQKILGLQVSPRPVMSVPHLLSDDAACCYHGYLLANMAVEQTRAFFTGKFGYLTDNPEIGPLMAKHYWQPGNSQSHSGSIKSLTGSPFSARYLAEACNKSADEAWQEEQQKISRAMMRPQQAPASLNASIRIIDGDTLLADNSQSDEAMFEAFEGYIQRTYFN